MNQPRLCELFLKIALDNVTVLMKNSMVRNAIRAEPYFAESSEEARLLESDIRGKRKEISLKEDRLQVDVLMLIRKRL